MPIEYTKTETLAVGGTVVVLTAAIYGNLNRGKLTISGGNVRAWDSGDTPSTSAGHILYVGDVVNLTTAASLKNFKAIEDDSGVTASLSCSYGGKVSS